MCVHVCVYVCACVCVLMYLDKAGELLVGEGERYLLPCRLQVFLIEL